MNAPRSTEASAGSRPDELAEAAFVLFSQRGIDGVNMDAIARGVGVTKGSLYWHYSSKKDVVLAACDVYYSRWRTDIAASVAAAATPYDRVEAAIRYSVRACLLDDGNRIFTTEIFALSLYDPEVRKSWAGFLGEAERFFLALTEDAVAQNELDEDRLAGRVRLMLSAMEGIKQDALFRPSIFAADSEDSVVAQLLDMVGPRLS